MNKSKTSPTDFRIGYMNTMVIPNACDDCYNKQSLQSKRNSNHSKPVCEYPITPLYANYGKKPTFDKECLRFISSP